MNTQGRTRSFHRSENWFTTRSIAQNSAMIPATPINSAPTTTTGRGADVVRNQPKLVARPTMTTIRIAKVATVRGRPAQPRRPALSTDGGGGSSTAGANDSGGGLVLTWHLPVLHVPRSMQP